MGAATMDRAGRYVREQAGVRNWFDAEPWRTGRKLLERLQQLYPGASPDGLLRTLQRRLKAWRDEMALGTGDGADVKEGNTSPPPHP